MAINLEKKKNSVVIKWTNNFSQETGFVKSVNREGKYFENTFDQSEAKVYGNKGCATTAIKVLLSYGEGENNTFEIVPA